MKKLNKAGFSLVELIIVIAIMAVLIGVLSPIYAGQTKKAKASTDLQNAQQIAMSIAVYNALKDMESTDNKTEITFTGTSKVTDIAEPAIQADKDYKKWYFEFDGTNVKVGVAKNATLDDAVQLYPTVNPTSGTAWNIAE